MDHEIESLEEYIDEAQKRIQNRQRLRESNLQENIQYPDEVTLTKLDSSIKKNAAFVKKLKVFTESQKEQVLVEIDRLNLTKFISEVATSIIEAKLKLSDIPAVIEVCTRLNHKYRDFSKHLLEQFIKYFPLVRRKNESSTVVSSGPNLGSPTHLSSSGVNIQSNSFNKLHNLRHSSDVGNPNPSKIRVDLRLFSELIVNGIFPLKDSYPVLINLLCYLMIYDKNSYQNANAILTFCKGCGEELMGFAPTQVKLLAKKYDKIIPTSDFTSAKRQEIIKSYIREYYQSMVKHLDGLYEELNDLVNRNKRSYKSKGQITKEAKELVDIKYSECLKTRAILLQLADTLDEFVPELPNFESLREETKQNECENEQLLDIGSPARNVSIWDDEGTRSFYEDLLDLRTIFPNLVPKATGEEKKLEELKDKSPDITEEANVTDEKSDINNDKENSRESTPTKSDDCSSGDIEKVISLSSSEESLVNHETSLSNQPTTNKLYKDVKTRIQPEQYFVKLSNCVNRDMIDNATIDFMRFFNTKFGRKKLVKTLFNVQRTRLDLLPFYSRLTATIYPYVPNVGNELVSLLKQDFKNLFRKKDQINIESKVKNVRFIGELVKFKLYSKQEALNCLKMLLSDFTHHHIEMTCNLLETCGRLLYKANESHHQLRLLLEQIIRKKLLLSIDSKYVTMIENAYYFTNPPEIVRQVVEEPNVYVYVRYLLYECLNRATINKVLNKIKGLNWNDKKLTKFVINCMIEAYNLKFYNIRYLAALLAALDKEHQWISMAVIDGVVEDILLMIEINELHFNQRRIPMIRYFGELYNYRLSDSSLVFKILYSLITYGVYYPEPEQTVNQICVSRLDAPDNLFRIKLVCDLLETCGQYLNSGQEKKKLDCFLLFFQRYYWYKKHVYSLNPCCMSQSGNQFPASVEYLYNDAICNLRPTFQMATSYFQARQLVQTFIDSLIATQPPT